MKKLICFLGGALLLSATHAQETKSLSIGDTVPDLTFNNVLNYKAPTIKLSDFKGKSVLIDFWASWCTTCIKGLPKVDSLQEMFKNDLQVMLVNPKKGRDSLGKISAVINRMDSLLHKRLSPPVVAFDTTASSLFPFITVPHYVWIDRDGVVRAITHKDQVTATNIRALIEGKHLSLPLKDDFFGHHKP